LTPSHLYTPWYGITGICRFFSVAFSIQLSKSHGGLPRPPSSGGIFTFSASRAWWR